MKNSFKKKAILSLFVLATISAQPTFATAAGGVAATVWANKRKETITRSQITNFYNISIKGARKKLTKEIKTVKIKHSVLN